MECGGQGVAYTRSTEMTSEGGPLFWLDVDAHVDDRCTTAMSNNMLEKSK
jgi:hypothetical protein